MIKVSDILGLENPKSGDVGMELEVEAANPLPRIAEKKWRCKEDRSLRGHSMEYYSSEPVKVDDKLGPRIEYLIQKLLAPEVGANRDSMRTSFHVHNNVTTFTPLQVWTAACAFWLFEPLLVKFCGEDTREGNCFCLRLCDAEAAVPYLLRDLKYKEPFQYVGSDKIRYMGLNMAAVTKFGSLESRTMRGVLDADVLHTWARANNDIMKKSLLFESPAALLDAYYRRRGELLEAFFEPAFVSILTRMAGWRDLLDENVGILCEIAYFHDWGKYQERVNKSVRRVEPRPQRAARVEGDQLDIANWNAIMRDAEQQANARRARVVPPVAVAVNPDQWNVEAGAAANWNWNAIDQGAPVNIQVNMADDWEALPR